MTIRYRHLALFVPDLQAAETYYRALFAMEVITREALQPDGSWAQLPPGKGWGEAEVAGITPGMVGLRREAFVLALFAGNPQPGQIVFIGLHMPAGEMAAVGRRLTGEELVMSQGPAHLTFRDRFQYSWQLNLPSSEFAGAGTAPSSWLDV